MWCVQLASLLKAGLSINESMDLMVQSQTDRKVVLLSKILKNLVNKGDGIHRSLLQLSEHGVLDAEQTKIKFKIHPTVLVAFEVGEATGTLIKNIEEAGERLRLEDEFLRRIISLLIYPVIVSIAALGMVAFLIGYIFPKIIPVFSGMRMELPFATRTMIALVTFGKSWGWIIITLTLALFVVLIVVWRRSQEFQGIAMGWLIRMPKIGKLLRYFFGIQLSRFLLAYISSGQSLSQALHSYTTKNILLKNSVRHVSVSVEGGSNFSEALKLVDESGSRVFPSDMCAYISIGERSGSLSNSLQLIVDSYEKKIRSTLESFASIIEPMLMIFIGVFIGWISLSIILPMYQVTEHVGR